MKKLEKECCSAISCMFLYYVEHRKESSSMITPRVTYYIEYIDPWWGSKVAKEGTFFEVYVAM